MTIFPMNKNLSDYEMIERGFPFYVSINEIRHFFPAHRHDFLECSLVIEGEGHETINGVKHPMSRGTFTLLLPYQIHEIVTSSSTPLRLFNCMFAMELLTASSKASSSHLQSLLVDNQQPYLQIGSRELAPIEAMFAALLSEYRENNPFRKELLPLRLHELLIHFQRMRLALKATESRKEADSKGNGVLWPVIEYIHYNYREDLSLAGLSDMFAIHPSRLSLEIKKRAGINFVQLLHSIRLNHACSLLVATDMSIIDVALEVGFSSYKVFARVFRENKGKTPGEYRREHVEAY
ncbi:AraC family transcriptional regulator [Cohnella sp. AR92]|uniref:AraC family transcriptional regulator n=1 Tax=Cohnella sp. AR92 TaxID=648716 RepID=UPI000F8EB9EE|nr:AraC family transcriptional regulator [Cohnella sp. AR92]RUS47000.1 AraC family transcriptional regulator [Cohnella sp. AR92]